MDLKSRGIVRVAKTKALISFAITAKLNGPLFLHMKNVGFLMWWLTFCREYLFKIYLYRLIYISHDTGVLQKYSIEDLF